MNMVDGCRAGTIALEKHVNVIDIDREQQMNVELLQFVLYTQNLLQ